MNIVLAKALFVSVFFYQTLCAYANKNLLENNLSISGTLLGDSMWKNNFHGTPFLLNTHTDCLKNQTFRNTWYVSTNSKLVKLAVRQGNAEQVGTVAERESLITKKSIVSFSGPPHIAPVLLPMHAATYINGFANYETYPQGHKLQILLNNAYPSNAKIKLRERSASGAKPFYKVTRNTTKLQHSSYFNVNPKKTNYGWEIKPKENSAFSKRNLASGKYTIFGLGFYAIIYLIEVLL